MWNKIIEDIKYSSLILAGGMLVLYGLYLIWPESSINRKIAHPNGTKTVEEIIEGSYTKSYAQDTTEWDTTWKSAITPIEENTTNGN